MQRRAVQDPQRFGQVGQALVHGPQHEAAVDVDGAVAVGDIAPVGNDAVQRAVKGKADKLAVAINDRAAGVATGAGGPTKAGLGTVAGTIGVVPFCLSSASWAWAASLARSSGVRLSLNTSNR